MFTLHDTILKRAEGLLIPFWIALALCLGSAANTQAQPAPSNDNLIAAQGIIGITGSTTGTNLTATAQVGEPAPAPGNPAQSSIWYIWTAPATMPIDFNTRNSTDTNGNPLDTVLAVYQLKGANLTFANLTLVARNDDDPSGGVTSRVDFNAVLNTTYLIQVDGSAKATGSPTNAQGYVTLNWGASLVAGNFGFSAAVFPVGSLDDYIVYNDPTGSINPSIRNGQGKANVRITVTRNGAFTGRCEVLLSLTNGIYQNFYDTNYNITNIYITNLTTGTYTNIFITNAASINFFEDDQFGVMSDLPLDAEQVIAVTNNNGTNISFFTNMNLGSLGLDNFFTNFPCTASSSSNLVVDPATTNAIVSITNVLCQNDHTNVSVAAAINGYHYTALQTNLVFDDYQMSKDVYVQIMPGISGLPEDYFSQGPEDKGANGDTNYEYAGLNTSIKLYLTNAVLDPLENPDILPPTIAQSTADLNILNYQGNPQPTFTNATGFDLFNFERETFRVNRDVGSAVVWVQRSVRGADQSHFVHYTVDSLNLGQTVIDYNRWAPVADADYAVPYDGQSVYDFLLPTNSDWNGIYGTLSWAPNELNAKAIYIPINFNGAVEFDQDILLQLFLFGAEATQEAMLSPSPAALGNIVEAHLTINFDNTAANLQPGGAVDRTYNPDDARGSAPPNNLLPGANQSVQAVAVQPNGMAVIGGGFTSYDDVPSINGIGRIQTNGFLDPTFNKSGSGANGAVDAVVIDSSGRIIIGGDFTSFNGANAYHIARLNPDGTLDQSFASTVGFGFNSTVLTLALDANGNILVGGDFTYFNVATNCNYLARLTPTGALDNSFLPSSGNGNPQNGTDGDVYGIAVDANGNIVLGGQFLTVNGASLSYLARLRSDGTVDPTFNPEIGPDGDIFSVAVQPDTSIIIGGAFHNYNLVSRNSIARLQPDGALDTTFTPGSGANDIVDSLMVQPNGNILVGGQFTIFNNTRRVGIARLLPQGWLDTSFMDTAYNQFAGLVNHFYNSNAITPDDPLESPYYYNQRNSVQAIGLEPDGNVLIGGSFLRVGGGSTRDDIRYRENFARLIGTPTVGPETGGIGNDPGNISFTQNPYAVGDNGSTLFVTLQRLNGSLGPAMLTLGTNTFPPGPGSAGPQDFGIGIGTATYRDVWDIWNVTPNAYGWRMSDGYYGFNNAIQPANLNDNNSAYLTLTVKNDVTALQDLLANISLLNLNNSFGLLSLGGVTIPSGPALGLPSADVDIINDNFPHGLLGFSATNYSFVESAGLVTITVLRTNGNSQLATVNYSTVDGTAHAGTAQNGADYQATSGQLTYQGGTGTIDTSNSFTVRIYDHSTAQPTKFFRVVLTSPTGAALDSNTPPFVPSNSIVTIIDDHFTPGHLAFSSPTFGALKGGLATISVSRLGGANGVLTVQVGTSDGTATNGLDYIGTTNTLTWNDKDANPKTFTLQTLNNGIVEGARTVNLTLFNATVQSSGNTNGVVITSPSTAVLTIQDIDSLGAIKFAAQNFNVLQNAGSALVTVVRTGGTDGSVSMSYETLNGTNVILPYVAALAGTNYEATSGQFTMGPGVSSFSFTVPILYTPGESNAANRILNLVLFNGSPGIASQLPVSATITILDNQLVLSPAGAVDTTTQNGTGFNDIVQSLSLQPDGKLVAGGNFTFFNQYPFPYVGRLNTDGSFDSGFLFDMAGANGTVEQALSQTPGAGQTNGSIMIVGDFTQVDQVNRAGIARLNQDGSLDTSFNPGSGADSTIFAIAETFLPAPLTNQAPARAYYIGGNFANFNGVPSGGIARLNGATNSLGFQGGVDLTFNPGLGVTSSNGAVRVLAVQADNKVILGGDFTAFNNLPYHHLVRLNPDGSVDSTFQADTGPTPNGSVRTILIQPDGRIVIGGLFTNVNGINFNYLARLNQDGSVDTNFNVGAGGNNSVLALAIDSQERLLVGGEFTKFSQVTRSGITRLNPDGTLDPTINFGTGANGSVEAIAIQNNDEINVGGGFNGFGGFPETNFARLYGGAIAGDGTIQFSQAIFGTSQNATNATITIQRLQGTAGQTVSATFSTSDGTGVAGRDYISVTTNVTFPYGETFETVTVPILISNTVGSNAIVNLTLSNPIGAQLGSQASAQLVITNVNTAVEFSAQTYRQSANVAGGSAIIPVVRVGDPNSTVAITVYTGTNGTASAYTNYIPETNILTFGPGVMTNYLLVPMLNATNMFGDLTVDIELSNPSNTFIGSPNSAILTIASVVSGPGVLSFSQTNYVVSEGDTNAYITIIRTNGSSNVVSVLLTTSNYTAIAGVNYSNVQTQVIFADGVSSQTVAIPVLQLTNAGPDVTVLLSLSNPTGGATIGTGQATLTIQNNIEDFSFSSPSYFVTEGPGGVTLTIFRGGPTNVVSSVNYTTFSPTNASETNGFAVPGIDYTPISSPPPLVFGVGETFQEITVPILQGNTVDGPLTFQVLLENPSAGAQVGNPGVATVTIVSDITGFAFSTNAYLVGENGSNVVVTVDRLNPDTGPVSVNFTTSDGTAINQFDYQGTNMVLNFANGQASTNIILTILNPNIVESNKVFNLTLSNPSANSFLVSPSNAVVIITNVLAGVSFQSPTYAVSECGVTATIPVIRTGLTNGTVSINYATSDGSGAAGTNYIPTSGTLTFTNGQTLQTFSVQVINNHIIGPDHTVQLNLTDPVGAQLLNPSTAVLTIQECNGAFIVKAGTAFVTGNISPGSGVIYSNETVTILFGMRDVAGGNTTSLVATLLPGNGVSNVSGAQNYGALVENGPTVSRPFTFTAEGNNGQNITANFTLQDGSHTYTNVAFGFTLGGLATSFTNPAPIVILDSTNPPTMASNYPSIINVSGLAGIVSSVTATLTNFGHTFPSDVEIVLESPGGEDSVLMAHCGGGNSAQHVTLTFDQNAGSSLTGTGAITSGTYLPTEYGTVQTLPSPAPLAPYPTSLATFVATPPNGNWSLFVVDDRALDAGYISNGWILNISTGTPIESDVDLELAVTANTTEATLSNTLVYSISVTNYGPSGATNVIITDPLPAGLAYVGNSCNCAVSTNGALVFTVGNLAVGAGTSFNITALPTALVYLTNTVTASANEPNPNSNNVQTVVTLVSPASADLGVTISGASAPVLIGTPVAFTVVVNNYGPSTASGVVATDVLPPGFALNSTTPSQGAAADVNGTITWSVGALAVNSSATLSIVATPTRANPSALDTVSVTSPLYDVAKGNNFASVQTEVDGAMLTVSGHGATLALTWSSAAGSYILEGATNLPPNGVWVPITNPPPSLVGGQYSYSLPGANGYHFFVLKAQVP